MTEEQKKLLKSFYPFLQTNEGEELLKSHNVSIQKNNSGDLEIQFGGFTQIILDNNGLTSTETLIDLLLDNIRKKIETTLDNSNEYWADNGLYEYIDKGMPQEEYFDCIEEANRPFEEKVNFLIKEFSTPKQDTVCHTHHFSKDMRGSKLSGACEFFRDGFAGLRDFVAINPQFKALKEAFNVLKADFDILRKQEFEESLKKYPDTFEGFCFKNMMREIFERNKADFYTENMIFSYLENGRTDIIEPNKSYDSYNNSTPIHFKLGEFVEADKGEVYTIVDGKFVVNMSLDDVMWAIEDYYIEYEIGDDYLVQQSFTTENGYISYSTTGLLGESGEGYYADENIPEIIRETLEDYYSGNIVTKDGYLESKNNVNEYHR